MDYPNVNPSTLWQQLRQQRITTVNFYNVLMEHSVSLYPY